MNDSLDEDLRALATIDPAEPANPEAHRSAAAQQLLLRVMTGGGDAEKDDEGGATSGTVPPRRHRWPILVGAAAALTIGLVLAPNVLGGDAYGSWTDVPAAATASDAQEAENACRERWTDFAATPGMGVPPTQVIADADRVVAEQRGQFTYTVLSEGTWAMDCLVLTRPGFPWGDSVGSWAGSLGPIGENGEPAANGVADLILGGMGGDDIDGTVLMLYGRVGAEVSAAVVHTPGAGDVEATVTNGFVAAWAPGLPADAFDEASVGMTLYLADGERVELSPDEVSALASMN